VDDSIIYSSALFFFATIGDFIGSIALPGEAYNLVQNVLIISAALTLLLMLRIAMKRYFQERKA